MFTRDPPSSSPLSLSAVCFSQIAEQIYKIVSLDYGVLVVAAAGNESSAEPHFPSDYDYVLSVGATTRTDSRASFSNYGFKVDISAPGSSIYTTKVNNTYGTANGTSFAAPIVSGAAALVKTIYPNFNGAQIGEVLRVTADPSFNDNLSPEFKDKLGRGRLDVYDALTQKKPSVRMESSYLQGPGGDVAKAGDEAAIYAGFVNFLWPVTGVVAELSSLSEYVSIVEGTVTLGSIQMMQLVTNQQDPFIIKVSENAPSNTEVILRVDYTAANYNDFQYIKILVNPSYVNLDNERVATTIAGNGRIGFQGTNQEQGLGFTFNGVNLLYEMGSVKVWGMEQWWLV